MDKKEQVPARAIFVQGSLCSSRGLSCGDFISRLRWRLAKVIVLDGADWGRGCVCLMFVEKQRRTSSGFCRVSSVRAEAFRRGSEPDPAKARCGES